MFSHTCGCLGQGFFGKAIIPFILKISYILKATVHICDLGNYQVNLSSAGVSSTTVEVLPSSYFSPHIDVKLKLD